MDSNGRQRLQCVIKARQYVRRHSIGVRPTLLSTGKAILHILSSNQLAAPAVRALEALNAQVGRCMCLNASENVNGFQE